MTLPISQVQARCTPHGPPYLPGTSAVHTPYLWRLDGSVCAAGRDREALGEELEVVDQRLHALLHLVSLGWAHLGIIHLDLSLRLNHGTMCIHVNTMLPA